MALQPVRIMSPTSPIAVTLWSRIVSLLPSNGPHSGALPTAMDLASQTSGSLASQHESTRVSRLTPGPMHSAAKQSVMRENDRLRLILRSSANPDPEALSKFSAATAIGPWSNLPVRQGLFGSRRILTSHRHPVLAAAARTGWRCEVRIRRDPKRPWRTGKLDHGPIAVAALNLDKASGSGFAEDRRMSRNRSFSRITLCFAALCIGPGVRRDTRVLSCWLARLPEV